MTHNTELNKISLAESIRILAESDDINNFHHFRDLIDRSSKETISLLFIAASRKGIIRDVEYMIPIVIIGETRDTINDALVAACENCHLKIIKLLLKNGAAIEYKNNLPLKRAVERGHNDAVIFLVEFGADVNVDNGDLVLECCRSGDYPDVLKTLISFGLNILSKYHQAYELCLNNNYMNTAEYLVKYSLKISQEKIEDEKEDCYYTEFNDLLSDDSDYD